MQFTLYGSEISPYAQRVDIALLETDIKYKRYLIDVYNKPEWFGPLVNPAGKVPAITYGGPDVPPDQPSKDSFKLAESLVIIQFVADLAPEAKLVPSDPVQRAKMRFFITTFEAKVVPSFVGFVFTQSESTEQFLANLVAIQDLLPETGFAVGEWSLADVAAGPFLGRIQLFLETETGNFKPGEAKRALEVLNSPRLARFQKYTEDVMARASFKKTWDADALVEVMRKLL